MSADNYALLQELPDGSWLVTDECASNPYEGPPRTAIPLGGRAYDTLEKAIMSLEDDYYEYGPEIRYLHKK